MKMTRWVAVSCAAAAVVCTGCSTGSNVNADADITLTGKVLLEDGQPVANTLLMMDRSTNSDCSIGVLFGDWNWKSVKTGADGAFTLNLLGADTQNNENVARCFALRPPKTAKGRTMSVNFLVQVETVKVPTLQEWSGTPAVAAGTGGVNVTFKELPALEAGEGRSHSLGINQKSSGSGTAWMMGLEQASTPLNDYILEDAEHEASLFATRQIKGSGTTFNLFYQGDSVALPKQGRVPASRGASCTYPGSSTVCPLTDGNLGTPVTFQEGTREVVFRLAQPKVLRKAVLRNFETFFSPSELVLEGSTDGTTWVPLANLLQNNTSLRRFSEIELSHPSALSHVRLRGSAPDDSSFRISSLSELSLFE